MNEPLFQRTFEPDLNASWDFVEAGLRDVIARCPTVPWQPRDVLIALRRGDAALYVRGDGFLIVQRCQHHASYAPYLNVWVMWFAPGAAEALRPKLIEWLDTSCRATGCEWWEFSSTREAWGRALEGDCEVAMLTWRRKP